MVEKQSVPVISKLDEANVTRSFEIETSKLAVEKAPVDFFPFPEKVFKEEKKPEVKTV